jgi:hypothetical protein
MEGSGRRTGYLVMLGNTNTSLHLDLPKEPEREEEQLSQDQT